METPDERYVRELFARRFTVELRKIPETTEEKTADFEMLDQGQRVAVVEVKTLERTPRTEANGWRKDPGGGMTRKDNAPKRVGTWIDKAWKQLRQYAEPKVLVFVNDETGIDVHDLEEAYHGVMPYGTEELGYIYNSASASIANGRIKDVKGKIDLYVWLDRKYDGGRLAQVFPTGQPSYTETRTEGPTFRCTTDEGYGLARNFGCPELECQRAPRSAEI